MPMTYNSLVLEIEDYIDRNDASTIARIPSFIDQAQQRICRESKNVGLSVYVSGTFAAGTSVYAKPGRWRRTLTINYGSGTGFNTRNTLELRAYEYVRAYWPDPTQTAAPLYYSDYGYTHFLVGPTPDAAYPFELAYLELPEPLGPNVQTNWLTDFAPDLLLNASLLAAIPYLMDDERIPVYQAAYAQALASINAQDDQRLLDRASNRSAD